MSFNELVSQCERDDRESNASSTEFYRGINDEIDKSYKEVASNSEEGIDLRATVLAIMLLFCNSFQLQSVLLHMCSVDYVVVL